MMLSIRAAAFIALLIGSARAQLSEIALTYGQQTCTAVVAFTDDAAQRVLVPFRSTASPCDFAEIAAGDLSLLRDPEVPPGFTGFEFEGVISLDFTVATRLIVPLHQFPPANILFRVQSSTESRNYVSDALGASFTSLPRASNAYAPYPAMGQSAFHITWATGLEVYELTAPTGEVYTMVHFNVVRIFNRGPASVYAPPNAFLTNLESSGLINPSAAGWTYNVRILTEPLLVIGDSVDVVTDDIGSLYVETGFSAPPAPLCEDGIASSTGSVCCASSCGACGGCACSALPGGAAACCPSVILEDGIACVLSDDVGCVLDASIPRPVGTGTGCSD